MTIEVSFTAYYVFYEVFKNAFIAKELGGKSPYGRGNNSPKIWEHTVGKKNKALEIFGEGIKDCLYFSRMRSVLANSDGKINAIALIKALEYLGFEVPQTIKNRDKIPQRQKAKILFGQFKKKHLPIMSGDDFEDEADATLTGKNLAPSTISSDIAKAKLCVETFYHLIAQKKLEDAWKYLSNDFQNREIWNGDFERFHDGYATTRGIRQIHAFNLVQTDMHIIECKVFYEDEVATYPIQGLQSLRLLTVAEIEDFNSIIKKIKKQVEEKGGTGFEKVPLSKLFDPTGMEFIWYECGFRGAELHKLFPKPYPEVVYRLYDCSCILIDHAS